MSMASESTSAMPRLIARQRPGLPTLSLLMHLVEKPWEFDFFQAVHLLRLFQEDVVDPGSLGPYARESVRFTVRNSLVFPASEIQEVRVGEVPADESDSPVTDPPSMELNFIGLQGPSGVLPDYYTQMIQQLDRNKENRERGAFKAWLDLFNHRLASYFYRTWCKYRPAVAMSSEFCRRPGGFDQFTECLLAVVGLGMLPMREKIGRLSWPMAEVDEEGAVSIENRQRPEAPPLQPFEDRFLIIHGATLGRRIRTASGLESLLSDFLGVPARVEQFSPRWVTLAKENQTSLTNPDSGNGTLQELGGLGIGAICGSRILDMQGHFRVRLGPIDSGMFQQFLPAATVGDAAVPPPLLRMVRDLVRFYAPSGSGFDIRLEICGTAIPAPVLKRDALVLGQSIWLSARNPNHTVDDVILSGELSA